MKKLNTADYTEECKITHNNFYDYSLTVYTTCHEKIIIICPIHGKFKQSANDHKKGSGCYECGIEKIKSFAKRNTKHFIEKSKKVHKDLYDYSKVNYVNATTKVTIVCPIHGSFKQTPDSHYRGNGCLKCGHKKSNITRIKNNNVSTKCWSHTAWMNKSKKSKNFHTYKCYLIKCWNSQETFYKIGKTFRTVNERFSNKKEMPYNWKLLKTWIGDAKKISELEKELQRLNKQYKVKPLIKFGGSYECFKKIKIMNEINLQRDVYEGWTPQDFIDDLAPQLSIIMCGNSWRDPIRTKEDLKAWCMDNQPYTKKHIPEIVEHFAHKYNLK